MRLLSRLFGGRASARAAQAARESAARKAKARRFAWRPATMRVFLQQRLNSAEHATGRAWDTTAVAEGNLCERLLSSGLDDAGMEEALQSALNDPSRDLAEAANSLWLGWHIARGAPGVRNPSPDEAPSGPLTRREFAPAFTDAASSESRALEIPSDKDLVLDAPSGQNVVFDMTSVGSQAFDLTAGQSLEFDMSGGQSTVFDLTGDDTRPFWDVSPSAMFEPREIDPDAEDPFAPRAEYDPDYTAGR